MVVFIFFFKFSPKKLGWGGGGTGLLGHPYSYGPAACISLKRKQCLRYMYHFLFYTYLGIPHEILIFGDTLINMKTENQGKKFVHNLKALKNFLQSPKAKKKLLPTQNCPSHPPPPKKNNKMVHPLQLNKAKWLRQNDVSRKLEPSVYQKSSAFHGNSRYGVTGTKSYGLLVGRKSLESVYSPGRQWVNTQPRWNGACDGNSELNTRKLYKFSNFKARFSCKSKRSRWLWDDTGTQVYVQIEKKKN